MDGLDMYILETDSRDRLMREVEIMRPLRHPRYSRTGVRTLPVSFSRARVCGVELWVTHGCVHDCVGHPRGEMLSYPML